MRKDEKRKVCPKAALLLLAEAYVKIHSSGSLVRPALAATTIPAPVTKDTESGASIAKAGEHPNPVTFTIEDDADIVFGNSSLQPYEQIATSIPNGSGIAAHNGANITVNKNGALSITSQVDTTKGTLMKGLLAHASAGESSSLTVNALLALNLETGNRGADGNNPKINGAGLYALAEGGTATLKVVGDVALDTAYEADRAGTFEPVQWLYSNSLTAGLEIVASTASPFATAPSTATAGMAIEGDADVTVRSVLNLSSDPVGSQNHISRHAAGVWMTNTRGNENDPFAQSSLNVAGDLEIHAVAQGGGRDTRGIYINNTVGSCARVQTSASTPRRCPGRGTPISRSCTKRS